MENVNDNFRCDNLCDGVAMFRGLREHCDAYHLVNLLGDEL